MNEKNWSKLSSVAELVSSIAILVTLIILVVEIRQNTEAQNAQSRQAVLQSSQTELLYSVSNPELTLSIVKPGALTPEENTRLGDYLTAIMRAREYSWLQFNNGIIDDEQWATEQVVIESVLSSTRTRKWWNVIGKEQVGADFAAFVDDRLRGKPVDDEFWFKAINWDGQ